MFKNFEIYNKNAKLLCKTIGSGTPILMIHGGGTDSDFFLTSALYLSKHFQVVIYDRRGYGKNAKVHNNDYSLSTQAKDAKVILDHIGKPAYVFAHSYGGLVALELAKIDKDQVIEYIIHEVPTYEGIDIMNTLKGNDEINNLIKNKKYDKVIKIFSKYMGTPDRRQKIQTVSELKKSYTNLLNYFKNEYVAEKYIHYTFI